MEIEKLQDIRNNDPKYKKWVSAVSAFNQGDYQTAISITGKIFDAVRMFIESKRR